MKRIGNLYEKICSIDNLILAEKKARRGKSKQRGVKLFDRNKEDNLISLHHVLVNLEYKTSKYHVFKIFEGKEREIFRLPYFPDRIVHHAIMNILEPIFVSTFTKDTYSCIKNRGIHKASHSLRKSLKSKEFKYCLKLDIQKFYPNIDHTILKTLLRKKFKDRDLLKILDEIIESTEGIPIGNYLSQWFANFYLSDFDHWLKEIKSIKHYFRYCDDVCILGETKEELHRLLFNIRVYLHRELKLKIKSNYQIFLIKSRGIDFVGYVHYEDYTLLRPSIKRRFIRMIKHNKNNKSIASYNGWLTHCNSINLRNTYIKHEK